MRAIFLSIIKLGLYKSHKFHIIEYIYFTFLHYRNSSRVYLIGHKLGTFKVNLLKEHWDITKYRATLGHKVNHSFTKKNTIAQSVIHPRFGPINYLLSTRKIKKGEEILWSYEYETKNWVPKWYAEAHKRELNAPWPGKKIYNDTSEV